jgi:hypothetical protein
LPRGARLDLRGVGLLGLLLMAAGAALYFMTAFWGFALRGKAHRRRLIHRKSWWWTGRIVWCEIRCIGRWLPWLWEKRWRFAR